MKILIVAQEFPYPPSHGGRADVWRRLLAMRELGHSIFLVSWLHAAFGTTAEQVETAGRLCAGMRLFRIDKSPRSIARILRFLPSLPLYAAIRTMTKGRYAGLLAEARAYDPDFILLDGIQGAWAARRIAADLAKPLIYRAHNVEHRYFAEQVALSASPRWKLSMALAAFNMKKLEQAVYAASHKVLNISIEDLAYWESLGFRNGIWLPPLVDISVSAEAARAPDFDLVFLGNLVTQNNVHGIGWFLGEVWPSIRAGRPHATCLIAGWMPTPEIVQSCKEAPGVILAEAVARPMDALGRARLLINPVQMGSGVNIKSIDMLATGKPVVSTSFGVAGIPDEARRLFAVADNAPEFADQCLRLLESGDGPSDAAGRARALATFGPDALSRALGQLDLP
jgi:hypothetical protein